MTAAWNCFRSPCRVSETAIRENKGTESRVANSRIIPFRFWQILLQESLMVSVTSSARCRKNQGTSRPSALAVFTLITSSNLVGSSTGKSEGFVHPLYEDGCPYGKPKTAD